MFFYAAAAPSIGARVDRLRIETPKVKGRERACGPPPQSRSSPRGSVSPSMDATARRRTATTNRGSDRPRQFRLDAGLDVSEVTDSAGNRQ
jgi:hypothetical protein